MKKFFILMVILMIVAVSMSQKNSGFHGRCRDFGIKPGILKTGPENSITDITGVSVGSVTITDPPGTNTGVTVILPHRGNIFQEKLYAGVYVGNGFGKAVGFLQIQELGTLESPIALTNTLNVGLVADALIEYTINQPGNEHVKSVNVVVGETNDGRLNNIRERRVNLDHVLRAIKSATENPVQEGSVGAGRGTVCFGFKGGIGTSSRVLPAEHGAYTVGVLVQTNFGGILTIAGAPVGRKLGRYYMQESLEEGESGSCMIVIATDAPLSPLNLTRMAKRAMLGLARTGGFASNGSGDFVIAFSTACRILHDPKTTTDNFSLLRNDRMSPLFLATIEATEEAIYNSLFQATTVCDDQGDCVEALPINKVIEICRKYGVIDK